MLTTPLTSAPSAPVSTNSAKLLVHEERPEAFAEHAPPFLRDALR